MKRATNSFLSYGVLIAFLLALSFSARAFLAGAPEMVHELDFQFFVFGTLLFIAYSINRLAPKTAVPSFVWAIFAGMAVQPLLALYTHDISVLKVFMELAAAFILFAGGMEIPFKNFKKWFFPIASLSFIGVIVSAVGFSLVLFVLSHFFGNFETALIPSIVIVSAALASIDPTAVIPTLKLLHFKRGFLKQIAIAESALTDVSGSILTRFLLLAFVSVPIAQNDSVISFFKPLLQKATYDALALQIISGIIVGFVGFALVKRFHRHDTTEKLSSRDSDPALLISVPVFTFVLGNALGGAGFLAAFVSGLLSDINGGLQKVSHFYESLLDYLFKPFIFMILGALVPLSELFALAPLGIAAALAFIFIVRPLVVGISLFPWLISGVFKWQDLVFLSFIRETGIISAILIVIAATSNIISSNFVIAIGMWVILLTLIIEPPLTPRLAQMIGVATKK